MSLNCRLRMVAVAGIGAVELQDSEPVGVAACSIELGSD